MFPPRSRTCSSPAATCATLPFSADADFGQRLKAFVVPGPGTTPDADAPRAYVKDNLARYKVPKDVVFLDELPRDATGKVLHARLLEHGDATKGAAGPANPRG